MSVAVLAGGEGHRQLALRSLVVFGARIVGAGLTLLSTLLLARQLGAEAFGLVFAVWAPVLLLAQVSTLNLPALATPEIATALARGNVAEAERFIRFSRRVLCLATPVAAAAAGLFLWLSHPDPLAEAPGLLLLALVSLPLLAVQQTHVAQAVALGRAAEVQVPNELLRPVLIVAGLLLLGAAGVRIGPTLAVALMAGALALTLAVQIVLTQGSFVARVWRDPGRAGGWLASAFALAPSRLLMQQQKALVVLTASMTLGLAETGVIALAMSLIGLLGFGILAAEMTYGPVLARAWQSADKAELERAVAASGLVRCVPVVGAAVMLGLLAGPVVALFGEAFDGAARVVQLLLVVPVVRAVSGQGRLLLQLGGHRSVLFWVNAVAILALLILPLTPLVPRNAPGLAVCVGAVLVLVSCAEAALARYCCGVDPTVLPSLLRRSRRTA